MYTMCLVIAGLVDSCVNGMQFGFSYSIIVFFFKQKTAYEMRISDWSSDVCSSDLADRPWARAGTDAGRAQDRRDAGTRLLGERLGLSGAAAGWPDRKSVV